MKNFKYLAVFLVGITSMQQIKTEESIPQANHQTAFGYICSYLWHEQKSEAMPTQSASSKAIIFDLGGVLFDTNKMQAFQEVGILPTLQYLATQLKLPSQAELFDVLATTPAESKQKAYDNGLSMPAIMIDWLTAEQSLLTIQLAMNRQIKNSEKSDIEKMLLLNTVSMMTTPEKFIATRKTIPAGVALLQELKTKGYKIYVLSNWDPTSFPLLIKKFPEIFTYNGDKMFDGVMISGKVGLVKPNSAIFEKCLTDFNLQASNTIFIDDTIENVDAAQNVGMTAIHCNANNMAATRTQLIAHLKKQ